MKYQPLVVGLLLLAGCGPRHPAAGCMQQALDETHMSRAVLVYDAGDGVRRWHGWRHGLPAPWVTVRAASLTKPIVAAQFSQWAKDGRFTLDEPLVDVLRGAPAALDRRVTLRRLLQHTSGLQGGSPGPDPLYYGNEPSCMRASDYVMDTALVSTPGTRVAYNNSGYCLLGRVQAQVLRDSSDTAPWLISELGGAGGWESTMAQLYRRLKAGMPISPLASEATLPDGSHYGFAWRSWPGGGSQAPFAHYGRLPGMVAIALSDGSKRLLVAHIQADPKDVERTSLALGDRLWRCMRA